MTTHGSSLVAALVWPFFEVARARGELVELGLSRVGLSVEQLQGAAARVSHERMNRLLESSIVLYGCRERGLLAAQHVSPGHFGLLEAAMRSQATLGDGLRCFQQLGKLLHDGLLVRVTREDSRVALELAFEGGLTLHPAGVEFGLAALVRYMLFATGAPPHVPVEVRFAHHAPPDVGLYREIFDCPVRFAAGQNAVLLCVQDLGRPNVWADELSAAVLLHGAEQALSQLKAPARLQGRVEQVVERMLERGECRARAVARELGMTLRTLQRKLAQDGSSVSELIDRQRARMADNYLRNPALTLDEIADRLGFSSTPGFHRAVRRWTQQTACERRRALLRDHASASRTLDLAHSA